ncbi:MAG: leucine-rich repeat protein [Clostridia bacterium]|nr:leucine-rich repeat protein [Clostridia bacterium]
MKKIFSAILAVMILLSAVPASALTANESLPLLYYEVNGDKVTITGAEFEAESLTIPESIDGAPVTTIADYAFNNRSFLKEIILPETITSIGLYAFAFSSITSINIPAGVTSIPEGAFSDCLYLKEVYYSGTDAEWSNVTIGDFNDSLLNAAIYTSAISHSHSSLYYSYTAPTCTESGIYEHWHCSDCDAVFADAELTKEVAHNELIIPALGHNFENSVCTLCGYTESYTDFTLAATSEHKDGKLYVYYDLYNNPGIWSVTVDMSFNSDALELAEVINGDVFTATEYVESPVRNGEHRYYAALDSIENRYDNGRLATYVFNIKDTSLEYGISLSVDEENVFDCDAVNKALTVVDLVDDGYEGEVVPPEVSVGDINGDGSINTQDVFRMKLFIKTIVEPTEAERLAADINGDGLINSADTFALSYRILRGEWA